MQITPSLLPHLAFYEALAVLDESNPAWNETVAGLLTLRLFDTWGEMARRGERVQAWEVTGVAEAVDELPSTHPARAPLRAVVDAVRAPNVAPADALPQLSAYARVLRFEAQWLLAADVFATMLTNAYGAPEDVVIGAAYHRGYCLRMAGQLEAAAASYEEGRALAASCGNEAGLLEADVSHAALALHRGNLPAAEALLNDVIDRAGSVTCTQVLAHALHERAHVAARRARPEDAVVFGYRALSLYAAACDRDRVLGDIATALGEAGHHQAAWDGHLVLALTAQEQEARWVATVNLMELSALRGNEVLFERFRGELAGVALPAWLTGYYHLCTGIGYHRFDRHALAVRALQQAASVAARFELNEIRIKADAALRALDTAPTIAPATPRAVTKEVAEIIASVRHMRELVGVSPA